MKRRAETFTARETISGCLEALDAARSMARMNCYMRPREGWEEDLSQKIGDSIQGDPSLARETFQLKANRKPLMHWVCHFGLSLDLIQAIHKEYPDACRSGLVDGVAGCLVKRSQIIVNEPRATPRGMLPVQEALRCSSGKAEVVDFLLRCYPEGARLVKELVFAKFPPDKSLPILKEHFRKKDIRDMTKSFEIGWRHPDPLPIALLRAVGEIHEKNSLIIRGKVPATSGFGASVSDEAIIVEVRCDRTFDFVVEEISKAQGLVLKAIEIDNNPPYYMDHAPSMNCLIAVLNPSAGPPPFGFGEEERALMAQLGVLSPPPFQPPPDLDLSTVERLTINSVIRDSEMMNELLDGIKRSLPNLRILELNATYSGYDGIVEVDSNGFEKLTALSDRLEEIIIRNFKNAVPNLLQLMGSSCKLEKASFTCSASVPRPTGDGEMFGRVVEVLSANTSLKEVRLDIDPHKEELQECLVDVVRNKANTTLEKFVVADETLSRKLEYFILMNRLVSELQEDDVTLDNGIDLIEPYSAQISIIYGFFRLHPDLVLPR